MADSHPQSADEFKVKDVLGNGQQSAFASYRKIYYGEASVARVLASELIITLFSWIPGALGLVLRKVFYPFLFGQVGSKVVFGRNLTIRHPHKIRLGDRVILDDGCVIDAKGDTNRGIVIGNDTYVGRNTIIYCKNGDIDIQPAVNISSNCQIFSSNSLTIGKGTIIGAFSYLLSGGEYDYTDQSTPFAEQTGTNSKGPLIVGENCWLAARVTVLDGTGIGDHCVLGAGAVVTNPIPAGTVAVGIPARVAKTITSPDEKGNAP